MNKWRLLLLSIFALLHITTSERTFIDGRYGCCDHTQRTSLSGTHIPDYESYQERRNLPEIRQLSKLDKYFTPEEPITDVTTAARRSRVEYTKQRSLDKVIGDENRRFVARQQIRLLSGIPEVIRGRQISRGRINERVNDVRIGFRDERFERQPDRKHQRDARVTSLTRDNNRRNAETIKRFKSRYVRHLDDNSCEVGHNIYSNKLETLTRRNTVNNNHTDRKISTKIVFNTRGLENERNTRPTMRQNEREDNSRESELSRITRRNNNRDDDGIEFKENKGRIGQNKKYLLVRTDVSSNENRERASRKVIRANNIIRNNVKTDDRTVLKDKNEFISQTNRRSWLRDVNGSPVNENREISSRRDIMANNVLRSNARIENRDNLKENYERINQVSKRSSTHDASMCENRERSNRIDIRRKNMMRSNIRSEKRRVFKEDNERTAESSTGVDKILAKNAIRIIRDSESEVSQQISRQQRDYTENRLKRDMRVYNDRLNNLDRNLEMTRLDGRQRQRHSEDSARGVRFDERIEFNGRTNFERIEQRIQKRSVSEEVLRNLDTSIERVRHIDNKNSRIYMQRKERIDTIVSRSSYSRHSEAMGVRAINENRVDVRRGNFERTIAIDSRINEIRRNLPAIENRARGVLRSQRNHRIGQDAIIITSIRNQKVLSTPIEIREKRNLVESRDANSRERRANEQTQRFNIRRESNSDRISNLRQELFKAENRRVNEDQNRISLRIRRTFVAEQRDGENIKASDNESRQLSRRSNNDDRLSNRKLNRDVRISTKNTGEIRINLRQETSLLYKKRIARSDYVDGQRSIRMTIGKTQSDTFEIKWQYLFYIVQAVYLCSLLVKIPKDEGTKKIRFANWFTPAEFLKID